MLYHRVLSPQLPPGFLAIDTETRLIRRPPLGHMGKTRIGPPDIPDLVCVSYTTGSTVSVIGGPPAEIRDLIAEWTGDLVFHNAAFDIPVLLKAVPSLWPLIQALAQQNRIWDTMLLDMLLQIARGVAIKTDVALRPRSLAHLAKTLCNVDLTKGPERTSFGDYADDPTQLPPGHLEYAALDAEATLRVFHVLHRRAQQTARAVKTRYPKLFDAEQRFGLLGMGTEVRAALAFGWLEQNPLRVDVPTAEARRDELQAEATVLEDRLITAGLARRGPKSGKFSLSHKEIRTHLAQHARDRLLNPPRSDTGLLSMEERYWADHIDRLTYRSVHDLPDYSTASVHDRLSLWLRYARMRKLLSTYLYVYASSPVHYPSYYTLGARTTRTAARRPSVQQIPKHRDGIRDLFIPRPGWKLVECDFKAAELVALAQVYHLMFGESNLETAINTGEDPHIATAKRLLRQRRWDAGTDEDRKIYRQMAKAVNFGLPGGMGYRKFAVTCRRSYGLKISDEEARSLRDSALRIDPALQAYLGDVEDPDELLELAATNLMMTPDVLWSHLDCDPFRDTSLRALRRLISWSRGSDAYNIPTPPGFHRSFDTFRSTSRAPHGAIRGRCLYTEAHNFPFQAAIACAAKEAVWNLYTTWRADPFWAPCAFIHDSVLAEAPATHVDALRAALKTSMEAGIRHACPDLAGEADTTPGLDRWGARTDSTGHKIR